MSHHRSCCTSTNFNRQKRTKRGWDIWVILEAQLVSVVQPVHVCCYTSLTSTSHLLLWNLRLYFWIHLTSTPTSLSVCPWWKRSQHSCASLNYEYKKDSNENVQEFQPIKVLVLCQSPYLEHICIYGWSFHLNPQIIDTNVNTIELHSVKYSNNIKIDKW